MATGNLNNQKTWQSADNTISKFVVVDGEWGKKPYELSECLVQISECPELAQYDGKTRMVGCSDSPLERILDRCLITMNENEIAKFSITSPENLNFTLKLEKMVFNGFIHQWDAKKKVEIATDHKKRGVELFHENRHKDAAYRFTRGLKILCSIPIDVEEPPQVIDGVKLSDINTLKAHLFNNLTSYYLKNKAWSLAIQICSKVLEFEPENIKAHYKLGVAFLNDKNYDRAQAEFETVLKWEPGNKAAGENMKIATAELMKANQRSDLIVKRMFKY